METYPKRGLVRCSPSASHGDTIDHDDHCTDHSVDDYGSGDSGHRYERILRFRGHGEFKIRYFG